MKRDREAIRERIQWLLETLFGGSQAAMARAAGVSPSLVSRVVSRGLMPGAQLVAGLASHPAINRQWLVEGTGPPLTQAEESVGDPLLPVSETLLHDSPHRCAGMFVGARPTARLYYAISRYWYLVSDPATTPRMLNCESGDLLLVDTNVSRYRVPTSLKELRVLHRPGEKEAFFDIETGQTAGGTGRHIRLDLEPLPDPAAQVKADKRMKGAKATVAAPLPPGTKLVGVVLRLERSFSVPKFSESTDHD